MAVYQDEITGKSYDDNSNDTLEAAKASKLKYLKNAGQTATIGGVDTRPSPAASPMQPSPSPVVDPYQNAARVLTGQPSLVDQSQALAEGGVVKKRYPRHPAVNNPAQVPGIEPLQQMSMKKKAIKRWAGGPIDNEPESSPNPQSQEEKDIESEEITRREDEKQLQQDEEAKMKKEALSKMRGN